MLKNMSIALLASASFLAGIHQAAAIENLFIQPPVIYAEQPEQRQVAPARMASAERSNMGGGFIEFLFSDGPSRESRYQQQPGYPPSYEPRRALLPSMGAEQAMRRQEDLSEPARPSFDPKFEKQMVEYHGKESAGTIIVDTPNKFLFLVQGDGKALRYGIGVGRPGFTWSGVKTDFREEGMAGVDAAAGNAGAPSGSAAAHGRRPAESARRPRDVSGIVALPHPRLQRTVDHRHQRLVRLLPDAQ